MNPFGVCCFAGNLRGYLEKFCDSYSVKQKGLFTPPLLPFSFAWAWRAVQQPPLQPCLAHTCYSSTQKLLAARLVSFRHGQPEGYTVFKANICLPCMRVEHNVSSPPSASIEGQSLKSRIRRSSPRGPFAAEAMLEGDETVL